jgi:S-formylglutathione hydrolase FrmB
MKTTIALLLTCIATNLFAAKVDTIEVYSSSMDKKIKNVVITPTQTLDKGQNYPLLFLLHGAGGNYSSWIKSAPEIKKYADQYGIVIVCPDGETTSWYFDSPIDPKMQYRTYINKELYTHILSHYPIHTSAKMHAISGLSMGGHGAMYSAIHYPTQWGAAGCISGGVDFRPFPNSWEIKKRLGSYDKNKAEWDKQVVINLVDKIKPNELQITIDCGVGDFFLKGNRALHNKLQELNIPHDYSERPGKHNWKYWRNAIKYQMIFFENYFKASDCKI